MIKYYCDRCGDDITRVTKYTVKISQTRNTLDYLRNSVARDEYTVMQEDINDSAYCEDCIRKIMKSIRKTDEIVKLPWKPKCGEIYFYVGVGGNINCTTWDEHTVDIMYYLAGNCFRTEAKAEAHKDEVLTKMKEVMER